MLVVEFYPEHRPRQYGLHAPFHFNMIFFHRMICIPKPVLNDGRARTGPANSENSQENESRQGEPDLEVNPVKESVAILAAVLRATAATRTLFARPGDIHGEGAPIQGMAIHRLNGLLRLLCCAHGDEAESARTARRTIHHQVCLRDRAVRGERVLQVVFGGIEGNISNKQFITHAMFCCTDSLLFQTAPGYRV